MDDRKICPNCGSGVYDYAAGSCNGCGYGYIYFRNGVEAERENWKKAMDGVMEELYLIMRDKTPIIEGGSKLSKMDYGDECFKSALREARRKIRAIKEV